MQICSNTKQCALHYLSKNILKTQWCSQFIIWYYIFPESGTYMLNVFTFQDVRFAIAGNDNASTLIRFIL
jgi:hypothetical protein